MQVIFPKKNEIIKAIKQSLKPILIHCWLDSDRTGVGVAMYRLVFQNWLKSQTINETRIWSSL